MSATAVQQESWLQKLIGEIGQFFEGIFNHAKSLWNELPKEQQDAIIQGVDVSQIIKEGYAKGEAFVISAIAEKTGISSDVATGVILQIGKDFNIDTGKVQDVLNHFADTVQAGITDNKWNALWEDVAKFAASWLSTGQLNWITLGMGVIQIALQLFIKPSQLPSV